jgi:Brp/Blh family beta-carotene 15,15'-monooxygenase
MKKYLIYITFIGLWIISFASKNFQFFFSFLLILTFGILHGANDFLIIDKIYKSKSLFYKFLYLALIIVSLSYFIYSPKVSLIVFVIFSSFHFGEQHYLELNIKKNNLSNLYKLILGLLIFNIIFYFKIEKVAQIISSILSFNVDLKFLEYSLMVFFLLFLSISLYFLQKKYYSSNNFLFSFFILVLFLIIVVISDLMWGFAIYFIIWHTIPSIKSQILFLYDEFNKDNLIKYIKKAVMYWILAMVFLYIFFLYLSKSNMFDIAFFSFLNAITLPHAILIHKMLNSYYSKDNLDASIKF